MARIGHEITRREQAEAELHRIEEQLRVAIEGVKDYAIFMLDHDGRVTTWNVGAERIKGYRAEEILGRSFSVFYEPADRERAKPEQALLAAAADRYEDEGYRLRKDGTRFWAHVSLSPFKDESGRLLGYIKVTQDLTERHRAEERFHRYFELGLVGMAITSPSRAWVEVNDELCRILGYERDELLRKAWSELTHPEDLAADEVLFERVLAGEVNGCTLDKRWIRKDGTVVHGVTSAKCVRKPDGTPDYLLSLVLDTTERARAEEALQHAYEEIKTLKDRLAAEKLYLEEEIRTERGFETIVGDSVALTRVLRLLDTVAPTSSTVLIEGETGTGKELFARAIHERSPRRERTFVKVNCASMPAGLLESELFGHERGAFTGAIAQRIGRFELAHEGTIFLDEVSEIPLELQAKLLRVLQEREFERVGGERTIHVDVRLIAATNRKLRQMVADGRFRDDLFFRLNVFPIVVPPLRERVKDIPALARHFIRRYAALMNKTIVHVPSELMPALCGHTWPGNVRELQNFIERSVIMTRGSTLEPPLSEIGAVARPAERAALRAESEREEILSALEACGWRLGGPAGAAARLGMKRTSLQYRIQKLGIAKSH